MKNYTTVPLNLLFLDERICCACKQKLPLSCFHKDAQKPDGYTYRCKECKRNKPKIAVTTKECRGCHQVKPIDDFSNDAYSHDAHSRLCKICNRKKMSDWVKHNYQRHATNCQKSQKRCVRRKREYGVRYHQKNKDKINKRVSKWAKENRPICVAKAQRYRAKKKGAGGAYTVKEWLSLCATYRNCCAACGEQKKLSVDHIVPVSAGGTNCISNIQPLCMDCNRRKHVKVIKY